MKIELIESDEQNYKPNEILDELLERAQTKPNQNLPQNQMGAQSNQSQSEEQLRFSINSDDAGLQFPNYGVQPPQNDLLATSSDQDGNNQTAQIKMPVNVQVQSHGHDRRFQNGNRQFEPSNNIYMNQSVVHLNMRQLRIQRSAPNVNTEAKKVTCQCHSRCQRTISCKCFKNGQSCGPYCGCLNCPDKYCPKKQTNHSHDQQNSFDEEFLRQSGECSFEPFQWEQLPI